MEVCPYLEETSKILGKSWNELIIDYLSRCDDCSAYLSDMKRDLRIIIPRVLSLKLLELAQWGLVKKQIISMSPVQVIYVLTEKGKVLAEALHLIEAWTQSYIDLTDQRTAKQSRDV